MISASPKKNIAVSSSFDWLLYPLLGPVIGFLVIAAALNLWTADWLSLWPFAFLAGGVQALIVGLAVLIGEANHNTQSIFVPICAAAVVALVNYGLALWLVDSTLLNQNYGGLAFVLAFHVVAGAAIWTIVHALRKLWSKISSG